MRAFPATVTAAALAFSVAVTTMGTASSSAAPELPKAPLIASYTCGKPALAALNAACGFLNVPLDYAKPKGPRLPLGFTLIRATSPLNMRQGMLVINSGGPGVPGLMEAERLFRLLPPDVRSTYDIVGFDPRGVATSEPRLTCDPNFAQGPRPSYIPTTGAGGKVSAPEKAWLKRSAKYATACKKKFPELLKHMTSLDTVRDIETLRIGLNTPVISFYGLSYGTYLAQLYAARYPTHTRRMVLDGILDSGKVWREWLDERPAHMQSAIRSFFGWTARNNKAYGIGTTSAKVEARYNHELNRLVKKPKGHLGSAEWQDAFLVAAYSRTEWPLVAAAFRSWVKGDPNPMTALWFRNAGVGNDNFRAVYLATLCTDAPWPRDYNVLRKKAFTLARTAPFDSWHTLWGTPAACLAWPVPGHKRLVVNGTKAPPLLLLNSTADPATPFSGAVETRRRFPRSSLVAEDGSSQHGVTLKANPCIDGYVARYLRDGTLPARKSGSKADAHCKKLPDPRPSSRSA